VAVAAMIDRLVHHGEVIVLQKDSYGLKDRAKEVLSTKCRWCAVLSLSAGVDNRNVGRAR
jgi:hypothetical protein